ncbi:hypothetical protein GJU40_19935 [Bacillus lacus]|uniref:Uncharacterized protein n=1 Tax=Metabacillus lacus TaxID=1983721 RepID=A0A7X2J306_9BACI|nr:hypothetical protein [Metabacillus lacus]MRX74394.1 hypothetical protein [Metabacillus lacus]
MGYYYDRDSVAGASDRKGRKVAGISDVPVHVKASIDAEEFCRAVRRCIINDLADADDRNKKHHGRCRRGWL